MEIILWPPVILEEAEVKNIAAFSYSLLYMVAVSARV